MLYLLHYTDDRGPVEAYTQVVSKFGRQAGLKAAANRSFRRGLVLANTTLFGKIDLRRFEPAWRPNFETTWVYLYKADYR